MAKITPRPQDGGSGDILPKFHYDSPLFIAAVVVAVIGDAIIIGGFFMGLALLAFAGLGLVPFIAAFLIRQLIWLILFAYVFTAMKSPTKLIPDGMKIKDLLQSVNGIIGFFFRPAVWMLLAAGLFFIPGSLTLMLIIAAVLQNKVVNMIFQQVAILGIAAVTGGAGAALEGGAIAEEAAEAGMIAGEIAEGASAAAEGGSMIMTTEETVGGGLRSTGSVSAEAAGEEELAEEGGEGLSRKGAKRRSSLNTSSDEDEDEKKAEELDERMNTGMAELRRIKGSLEDLPFDEDSLQENATEDEDEDEGGETVDLRSYRLNNKQDEDEEHKAA